MGQAFTGNKGVDVITKHQTFKYIALFVLLVYFAIL